MTLFCPDCGDDEAVYVENHSFDHEFGTEWLFDYHCAKCSRLLRTERNRPRREKEPD